MKTRAILTALLAIAASHAGAAQQCADPLFKVDADTPELADKACTAAMSARAFLAQCSVVLDTPVSISIEESLGGDLGDCLGIYHCGENRLQVLSPEAMAAAREDTGAFAGLSEAALWDSIFVHELTHAAYDSKVSCPFSECVATSEYASYAMQVLSLPPDERDAFGASVALSGPPTSDMFSAVMLYMAPDRFAKTAWLHFQSRPDPCDYMGKIMRGQIYFDREPL